MELIVKMYLSIINSWLCNMGQLNGHDGNVSLYISMFRSCENVRQTAPESINNNVFHIYSKFGMWLHLHVNLGLKVITFVFECYDTLH